MEKMSSDFYSEDHKIEKDCCVLEERIIGNSPLGKALRKYMNTRFTDKKVIKLRYVISGLHLKSINGSVNIKISKIEELIDSLFLGLRDYRNQYGNLLFDYFKLKNKIFSEILKIIDS